LLYHFNTQKWIQEVTDSITQNNTEPHEDT
jgi:hypothetical protein